MQASLSRVEYWGSVAQWIEREGLQADEHLARVSYTLLDARPAIPDAALSPAPAPSFAAGAAATFDRALRAIADAVVLKPRPPPPATVAAVKAAAAARRRAGVPSAPNAPPPRHVLQLRGQNGAHGANMPGKAEFARPSRDAHDREGILHHVDVLRGKGAAADATTAAAAPGGTSGSAVTASVAQRTCEESEDNNDDGSGNATVSIGAPDPHARSATNAVDANNADVQQQQQRRQEVLRSQACLSQESERTTARRRRAAWRYDACANASGNLPQRAQSLRCAAAASGSCVLPIRLHGCDASARESVCECWAASQGMWQAQQSCSHMTQQRGESQAARNVGRSRRWLRDTSMPPLRPQLSALAQRVLCVQQRWQRALGTSQRVLILLRGPTLQ